MKQIAEVVADALRSNLFAPNRANEAAHVVIEALESAGYAIVQKLDWEHVRAQTDDLMAETGYDPHRDM